MPRLRTAPDVLRHVDHATAVNLVGQRIVCEAERPVEINDVAQLTDDESGRHRECGSAHVADHHLQAMQAGGSGHAQRLGKAAAFIELDVYYVKIASARLQLLEIENAFVRRHWHSGAPALQARLVSAFERLFDQSHGEVAAGTSEIF